MARGNKFSPIPIPYIPEKTSYEFSKFPPAFIRCLDKKLPEVVYFRDKYGNAWSVQIEESKNVTYILEGWPMFIAENFVKPGDLLILRYDGDSSFDVKIFGFDGCEKEGAGRLIGSNAIEEESDGYSTDEETEEEQVVSQRRRRIDPLCPDLFRSGRFAQPQNPYFVTGIRTDRIRDLCVPRTIIKRFKLRLPKFIVLRDPVGRKWNVERTTWMSGRQLYGGGWKDLCRLNYVTDEDLCICEFIKTRNGDDCIQVQIARRTGLA